MWYIVEKRKLPITLPESPRWQHMCCPTNISNHKRVQFTIMWNREKQQSSYLRHWKHRMLDTFTFINNSSCTYVLKVTLCFFSISPYVCASWGDKDYYTTPQPSLPLSLGVPAGSCLEHSTDLFNEVPTCSRSCFLSAQIHSDTRDMLGFISGRPGLCAAGAGITSCFTAKIFTTRRHRVRRKAQLPVIDEGPATRCIIPGRRVCVTSEAKKKISKCTFVCFSGEGKKGGCQRTRATLHRTAFESLSLLLIWFIYFFPDWCSFMTPTLCDKSQHLSGDTFMTSFTLHFQPWASFWLGL